jgi:hypothetical protein
VRRITFFALFTLLVAAGVASSADVVQIRLRGHFFAEPATVQITVAIEPAAQHRILRIAADGERYYRASEVTLDGENGQRLHSVVFKNLPAGSYTLIAEVLSSEELLARATQELRVTSSGGREP